MRQGRKADHPGTQIPQEWSSTCQMQQGHRKRKLEVQPEIGTSRQMQEKWGSARELTGQAKYVYRCAQPKRNIAREMTIPFPVL